MWDKWSMFFLNQISHPNLTEFLSSMVTFRLLHLFLWVMWTTVQCILTIRLEEKNHRMVERDLQVLLAPIPLLRQRHPEQVPRTISRKHLKIFKETPEPLDNLHKHSVTLTEKKCFLIFSWNLLFFHLFPLHHIFSNAEESLAPFSLLPSFRYL